VTTVVTAAVTVVLALALSFATRNRVARGKLRFAALVAVVGLALSAAMRIPALAASIPPEIGALGEVVDVTVTHRGRDYHVSFRRLDGSRGSHDTAAMPRTSVTLIVLAVLVACSLAGGGFFDGHGTLL